METMKDFKSRRSQRGAGSTVAVVILVLFVVTVLGLSYMEIMKSEAVLTSRTTESAVARFAAEGAIEEFLVTLRSGMNKPGTPWFDRFRLPMATGSFTAEGDASGTLALLQKQAPGQSDISCRVKVDFKAGPFPGMAGGGYGSDPIEKAGILTVRADASIGAARVAISTAWDVKVVSTAPPEPLAGSTLFCIRPSASPVRVPAGSVVSTADPSTATSAPAPSSAETASATGSPKIAVSRISRFFDSFEEMTRSLSSGGFLRLEGLNLLNLPRPPSGPFPVRDMTGLRIKGSGGFVFMNTGLSFSAASQEGPVGLQMLNGGDVSLSGNLTGFVYAPGSTLSGSGSGFTLDGAALVSELSGWSSPGGSAGVIRHRDTSGYAVSLSRQSMGFRRL